MSIRIENYPPCVLKWRRVEELAVWWVWTRPGTKQAHHMPNLIEKVVPLAYSRHRLRSSAALTMCCESKMHKYLFQVHGKCQRRLVTRSHTTSTHTRHNQRAQWQKNWQNQTRNSIRSTCDDTNVLPVFKFISHKFYSRFRYSSFFRSQHLTDVDFCVAILNGSACVFPQQDQHVLRALEKRQILTHTYTKRRWGCTQ